ncbi:hypothetical protein [Jeotgalibaca arthritidis]|uniref:hypothetical protein n=1 Tax=Jeotgalibaca arthritidis TaxID=1868794 RepID=UPI00359F3677
MKNILLYWGWDADLIMVPNFIADNLSMYQKKFDKWISNTNNNHEYWAKDSEGELALSFNGEAFVKWLNENIIENVNEKASFIKKEYVPSKEDMNLPRINF